MADISDIVKEIRMLVLDVDGVLTDGTIYYGNSDEEYKAFNIKDGLGIKMLQKSGVIVAIITGRSSAIVTRRARELGIEQLIQGREDKLEALRELSEQCQLSLGQCAYMGDDLPDLGAIKGAGLGMTVADATSAVRKAALWISDLNGGAGAVRQACEFILAGQDNLTGLEDSFL